jgi:hypothetical protein
MLSVWPFAHDEDAALCPFSPFQLGDTVLVLSPLTLALEEALHIFEGDVLRAGDESGLQLVLPGDFGRALQAGEDFDDDLGLDLEREGPSATIGH